MEFHDVTYSLEVGLGTIELITGPFQTLHEMKETHERALLDLKKVTDPLGWAILGFGIQPFTEINLKLMSPKKRYELLHQIIGPPWLHFAASASDQVHVDITRSELVQMINLGNLLAPVLIAFCANSSVIGGQKSQFLCSREGLKTEIFPKENRHGMIDSPIESIDDYIQILCEKTFLFDKKTLEKIEVPYVNDAHLRDFDEFLHHDHYIWNSARPRCKQSTIEIRPACQQPFESHMVVSALSLGWVEMADKIESYFASHFDKETMWSEMKKYHGDVIKVGLKATEPKENFLFDLLTLAKSGLKNRGFSEEHYIDPLFDRLSVKASPGEKAMNSIDTLVEDYKLKTLV